MMKIATAFIGIMISLSGFSQEKAEAIPGHHHLAGTGISVPLGDLRESHYPGIQLHYQWSRAGYHQVKPSLQRLSLTAGAGAAVFPGKGEKIIGQNFKYRDYFYFHLAGGAVYRITPSLFTGLQAGPGLGVNGPTVRMGVYAQGSGSWFVSHRIAIGPSVEYRKHTKTNALWTASIRASYLF